MFFTAETAAYLPTGFGTTPTTQAFLFGIHWTVHCFLGKSVTGLPPVSFTLYACLHGIMLTPMTRPKSFRY